MESYVPLETTAVIWLNYHIDKLPSKCLHWYSWINAAFNFGHKFIFAVGTYFREQGTESDKE